MAIYEQSANEQVASIFLSYFERAPEFEAMDHYVTLLNGFVADQGDDPAAAPNAFKQLSAQIYIDGTTHGEVPGGQSVSNAEYVDFIYQNVLGRPADAEGRAYWISVLESGEIERADLVAIVINSAADDPRDAAYVANRTEVALEFSKWDNSNPSILNDLPFDAKEVLDGVDDTPASVVAAMEKLAVNYVPPAPIPDTMLTVGIDNLVGSDGDDVFTAPIVQNDLGNTSLTLQSGDTIEGGGGRDTLVADLQASASNAIIGTAISPTTNNVEVVELRQQGATLDQNVNWSDIDAENMNGIEELWSVNSRGDIQVEDVRVRAEDMTIGMRETDGRAGNAYGASLEVYFDPAQLLPDTSSRDSALTLTLDSISQPGDLSNVQVDGFSFSLGGETHELRSDDIGAATNHDELLAAVEAALEASGLDGVSVALSGDNTITLLDAEGRTFETGSWTFIDGQVPADGDAIWAQQVGAPVVEDVPLRTNIELDFVGRTAQGGYLNVAGMNNAGIEVFDVSVDRDSWISEMASQGEFGFGDHFLETVNLTSIGEAGDLAIGYAVEEGYTGYLDGRVVEGLWDVREVLNQGFEGDLSYGVVLTYDAFDRYIDHAGEEVMFTYEGGSGNDNITIEDRGFWSGIVSSDPDFFMNVDLGAGDDRLNIDIDTVASTSVDGGEGDNTIAVSNSHGTSAANTFENFANFQTYEVEGTSNTAHDFTSMAGVETVNIATRFGADTVLRHTEADTDITITGKNQTMLLGDWDASFGDISVEGAQNENLTITLENTARLAGELTVDSLRITDSTSTLSEVRTLNIVSDGRRDTSNVVESIEAARVTTLNLEGTQDLAVRVDSMGNLPVTWGITPEVTIDASELEGDAVVAVDVPNVLDNDYLDFIIGTAGGNDILQLFGVQDPAQATNISGFETIQFGGDVVGSSGFWWDREEASGMFDARNVSDVELYDIQDLTHIPTWNLRNDVLDAEEDVANAEEEIQFWKDLAEAEDARDDAQDALVDAQDDWNDADSDLTDANNALIAANGDLATAQGVLNTAVADEGAFDALVVSYLSALASYAPLNPTSHTPLVSAFNAVKAASDGNVTFTPVGLTDIGRAASIDANAAAIATQIALQTAALADAVDAAQDDVNTEQQNVQDAQDAVAAATLAFDTADDALTDAQDAFDDAQDAVDHLNNVVKPALNDGAGALALDLAGAEDNLDDAEAALDAAKFAYYDGSQEFTIFNMDTDENVSVNGTHADGNISLIAGDGYLSDAHAAIHTLNLEVDGSDYDGIFTIIDFGTVNIDVTGGGNYDFGLNFYYPEDDQGNINYGHTTDLFLTGGASGGSLTLDDVDATVELVDFSGVVSDVNLTFEDMGSLNTHTTVVVNNREFTVDESTISTETVTTYVFTTDAASTNDDWTIEGFQAFDTAEGSLSNLSILDFTGLAGVDSLLDLNISDDGTDTTITSNGSHNFEIILTGVVEAELNNENFIFG